MLEERVQVAPLSVEVATPVVGALVIDPAVKTPVMAMYSELLP
jgi:hypothetical protein